MYKIFTQKLHKPHKIKNVPKEKFVTEPNVCTLSSYQLKKKKKKLGIYFPNDYFPNERRIFPAIFFFFIFHLHSFHRAPLEMLKAFR